MFVDDLAVVADRPSRAVGRVEGNLWQTWAERESREDGGALGRAAKKSRYKTGREETAARRRKFAGEYKFGRGQGGKWKG